MTTIVAVLIALAFAAPGDLYRCSTPDGRSAFQDRPCAQGQGAKLPAAAGGAEVSPQALREWLRSLPQRAPVLERPRGSPASVRATGSALDERSLAGCSAIFLDCADQRRGHMDHCVANAPRCPPSGGDSCCPAATVADYARMRRAGAGLSEATRGALLGQ